MIDPVEFSELQQYVKDLNSKMASMQQQLLQQQQHLTEDAIMSHRLLGTSTIDSGDTAWVITASFLVLFMTIPGLVLFYVGMVRTKNVLATVMQIFSICALITYLWLCFGYSLAFGPANGGTHGSPFIGDASRFWLSGMTVNSIHQLAPTIPESVFCTYQLTFAIITPALICGSFADRMKFWPMLLFMTLWHFIVYCPIAHSVWHPDGFLYKAGVYDYAGGNVVEVASGVSGLVSAIVLGHRKGYGKEAFEPHNILLTTVGAGMLWAGWYGFNGGSALTSGTRAGYAVLVSQIAAGVAGLSWTITEFIHVGQPKVVGMVSGAISGLVAITPASGFVDPTGAFFIGLLAGPVCYFGVQLKHRLGYDDALDAFGIHAIGGMFGNIMTGFFASGSVAPDTSGVFYSNTKNGGTQLAIQLYATVFSTGWSAFMSYIILKGIDMTIGLRVSEEEEEDGMDSSYHKESLEPTEVIVQRQITRRASLMASNSSFSQIMEENDAAENLQESETMQQANNI